jgi:hypothetical protein
MLVLTEDKELIGKIALQVPSIGTRTDTDLRTMTSSAAAAEHKLLLSNLVFGGDGYLYLTMAGGGVARVAVRTKPVRIMSSKIKK